MSQSTISLNCYVLQDQSGNVFTVKIPRTDNVAILKESIKEKKARLLTGVDASDLDLFLVSLDVDRVTPQLKIEDVQPNRKLHPVKKISSVFSVALEDEDVHILVERPADIQAPVSGSAIPLLSLRCHLLGDGRNTFFTIEIEGTKDVSILKKMIKADNAIKLNNFDARELIIHNASLSLADFEAQFDTLDLESYPILSDAHKLSTIFPNTSDSLVQVIVNLPPEETSPSARQALYSIDEDNQSIFQRELVAAAARKRDPPSTGAKNSTLRKTQKGTKADAVYNGRPIDLTGPPIGIYHSIFAKFLRGISAPIEKSTFTANELGMAFDLVTNSLAFYDNEDARVISIATALNSLVDDQVLRKTEVTRDDGKHYYPDGAVIVPCENIPGRPGAASAFAEVKNGIGEGGSDPINQSECDYVLYYSRESKRHIRDACCCPAFLIGIAGAYMIISGAVFADRFISQPLTEYIFLGGTPYHNPRLYEIARVLKTLKLCLDDLEKFYGALSPASSLPSSTGRNRSRNLRSGTPQRRIQGPSPFPHFCSFTAVGGVAFELKYVERLVPHYPEKAVFKATVQREGQDRSVVVKFTPTYCAHAHALAYELGSAPELWFCDEPESVGMVVVVMDYIEGGRIDDAKGLPEKVLEPLRGAISALHEAGLVHGDLRGPNVMVSEGQDGGKRAMLVDFDWGGEEGDVFYPADINMQLKWHDDVGPGTPICREHDLFMLDRLASAGKTES